MDSFKKKHKYVSKRKFHPVTTFTDDVILIACIIITVYGLYKMFFE